VSDETPTSISPASIAAQLGSDRIAEGYVCFKGYLQIGNAGTHRIVVDEQFVRWLEVNAEDIVGQIDGSADPADRRDQIWVKRGARMAKCEVAYAPEIANEGWGVDTDPLVAEDDADVLLGLAAATTRRPDRRPNRRRPPPPY